MDIEVHRAGRTFYAHTVTLLNIPGSQLDAFFNLPEWPAVAAAKFLGLPEVANRSLSDFAPSASRLQAAQDTGLSRADLDDLLSRQDSSELTPEQMVAEMKALRLCSYTWASYLTSLQSYLETGRGTPHTDGP